MVDAICSDCSFTNKLEFKKNLIGKTVMFKCKNPSCRSSIKFTFPPIESITKSYQTVVTDYNMTSPSRAMIKWYNLETNKELSFILNEGVNIIGRMSKSKSPNIAIPTSDMSMSRMHCVIIQSSYDAVTSFLLKEYNNKNQLILNGKKLHSGTELYLEVGDRITLGITQITFNKIEE